MTSTKKRKKEDGLSNLPEDILTNVLSLLPFKEGVQSSILSKRWRYIWMMVPNLKFDNVNPYESVSRVLELRKSKVEILQLHFPKLKVPKSAVSKWISEAIRLNVSELDIMVKQVDLPLSLFTCKTLTTFRLKFHSRNKPLWTCPSLVILPCLKTLDIVLYSNPLDNAFRLIHGCPILENLSLEIRSRESEENYYFEIPTLKRLTLSIFLSIETNHKFELNLPNLEYLSIVRQSFLQSHFVIKDLSSLVEAKASCSVVNYHWWYELLIGISNAKCISLNILYFNVEFNNPSSLYLPEFPNVKHLELGSFYGRAWLLVPKILERCSQLEHFCIKEPFTVSMNEMTESVPSCMLTNLKTMKLTNSRGNNNVFQFLKFMLANSNVLKTLTVTFDNKVPLNEEGSMTKVISRLPRASEDCKFHFVGKWPHATTPWHF